MEGNKVSQVSGMSAFFCATAYCMSAERCGGATESRMTTIDRSTLHMRLLCKHGRGARGDEGTLCMEKL